MHGKTPRSLAAPQRTNGSIPSIFGGEIGTGMRRVPAEFVTRGPAHSHQRDELSRRAKSPLIDIAVEQLDR